MCGPYKHDEKGNHIEEEEEPIFPALPEREVEPDDDDPEWDDDDDLEPEEDGEPIPVVIPVNVPNEAY